MLEELRGHDAILLGAIGDPSVPPGVLERGLLLRLRFALDHHVNLRPVRLFPGVTSPLGDASIDMVVVREGTEGPYVGNGGTLRGGTAQEVATEVSLNTAYGVERVVRDAFAPGAAAPRPPDAGAQDERARARRRAVEARVRRRRAREFPDVETAYQHVDAASMFFVTDPGRFDVVVTDNLFGDILTDIGAAIGGGIGLAASRQPRRQPQQPQHVRAGARQRSRHRRAGRRRPHRRRAVGRPAARAPRPPARRPAGSRRRWRPTSPVAAGRAAPQVVQDALLARL